jgi:hypothetical protein
MGSDKEMDSHVKLEIFQQVHGKSMRTLAGNVGTISRKNGAK